MRVLIDPWSEGLHPLIYGAEEKGHGLRGFTMSQFEVRMPVQPTRSFFII